MIHSKNILIVCRDNIPLFNKWKKTFVPVVGMSYYFATDNNVIRSLAYNIPSIKSVLFLEKAKTFFSIGGQVIAIQAKINQWLTALEDPLNGLPAELIYFNRHIEGGYTSQRVQDAVLLIDSYTDLFKKNSVEELVVLKSNVSMWDDDVMIHVADTLGIPTRTVNKLDPGYIKNVLKNAFRAWMYEPFFLLQFAAIKISNGTKNLRKDTGKEVVFQLCSSANKHVGNILANIQALKETRYVPVVLSWGVVKGAREICKNGFIVDQLENWLPVRLYFQSLKRVLYTLKIARKRKSSFLDNGEITYSGISLGKLLWPAVTHLILAELGKRWRILRASERYFSGHLPLAISPWGINDLPEGKMVLDVLQKYNKPFIFKYYLSMVMYETPYRVIYEPVDLYLVGGAYQMAFNVNKLGISPEKNAIVGQPRYNGIQQFKKEFSRSDSLKELNIPQDYNLYILFDYSNSGRGYLSYNEQYVSFTEILQFVSINPNIALIIKPHPGSYDAELNSFKLPPNSFVIDKATLPYHCLNCCDFFITKYSTVGFEAMLFSKPVISIILDKEKAWRVYDNAAHYFEDINQVISLLECLINEREFYNSWIRSQIECQQVFLYELLGPPSEESAALTARAITTRLDQYKPQAWK